MLLCGIHITLVCGESLRKLDASHGVREVTDESVENIIRRLICAYARARARACVCVCARACVASAQQDGVEREHQFDEVA